MSKLKARRMTGRRQSVLRTGRGGRSIRLKQAKLKRVRKARWATSSRQSVLRTKRGGRSIRLRRGKLSKQRLSCKNRRNCKRRLSRKSHRRRTLPKVKTRRRRTKLSGTVQTMHQLEHDYEAGFQAGFAKGFEDGHQLAYANQA